ncbi:hypothetical protein FNV43_RR10462 [Rhamnella rubrinervis]|uniref:Alpha 1,4-glycosyltransferase domain-containing protein n=1 Tax=Rhamnella rubrinervis TaxID=2594499 RepID=A0A8K0HBV3_9ROSA|nr:hypothetical protein FNV43_RR10462 [Rhamnella rubrinervis]
MCDKLFDKGFIGRAIKFPVLSSISLVVLILIFYSDTILSTPPHHHLHKRNDFMGTQKVAERITQFSVQERIRELALLDGEYEVDPMIPPENVTKVERIKWFRKKLPELEILHSNNLTKQFHGRVLEFLNNGCSIQFYMVWLSPARFFGNRDFLAVDTLFKSHPQGCLMIISRTMDSRRGYRILKPLLDHGFKVLAVTPDLPFLVKNTPAESWLEGIKSGKRDPGYVPLSQNLCNLIRLSVLHRYGGVYLDTDMIILRDFSELRNSVGAQTVDPVSKKWITLNGAVMIFDINHPILLDFIEEFSSTFNGNRWGFNGPFLVTRVIGRVGSTPGYNVTVMPPEAFYPVNWLKIHRLFKKPESAAETRMVESTLNELNDGESGTFAVHLWNKRSKELKIEEGSVMARLILDHCVICQNIFT